MLFLGPESPAVDIARHIQFLASWNFVLFAPAMIYSATMRAGGAVWVPLVVLAIALYPVRLGFYWLTYGALGADAIWWSFPVGAAAGLVLSWAAYRYLPWRPQAVAESEEEAREQAQADGQPAGRMAPEI